MNKLNGLIFLLIATANVQARLGKTVEECDELYGKAPMKSQRTQNGWLIKNYATELNAVSCRFYNNYCFEIGVNRFDKDGKIVSLTPEQVVSFIKNNLGTIPKVDNQGKNVGANTVEHALGSDGRYVWREEQTATGIITIVRDNTLAPASRMNNDGVPTNKRPLDHSEISRVIKSDALDLENKLKSGLEKIEKVLLPLSVEHFDIWDKAANLGLPDGQFLLGMCHLHGLSTSIDRARATEWLTKASDQNHARAQVILGILIANNKPSKDTAQICISLWERAANHNLAEAQYLLGIGNSASKDKEQIAFRLMHLAASQEYALAQFALSEFYIEGTGCKSDPEKAVYWLQKSADQGYSEAQYRLGLAYAEGKIVTKDSAKAAKLFRLAADGGHLAAKYALGRAYFVGQGIEQNYTEGRYWLRAAAKEDHTEAQFLLGYSYFEGMGIQKNYEEAINWYQKAAEKGHKGAQLGLTQCYANGLGIRKDVQQAYQWSLVAGKDDPKFTTELYADIEKKMTESQVKEARRWAENWKPIK